MPEVIVKVLLFGTAVILSWVGTRIMLAAASTMRLMDVPNPRSSHTQPKPRGGGIGIVLAFLMAVGFASTAGDLEPALSVPLVAGTCLIAVLGLLDDRYNLRPPLRLSVQIAVCTATAFLLAPPGLDPVSGVLWVLGLLWLINAYNFMDGIDGLAGSEAIFVAIAAMWLFTAWGVPGLDLVAIGLAGAALGFTVLNWPPARIFMGDVGSGCLGYIFGTMALVTEAEQRGGYLVWIILLGVFLVDSTVTLLRRALTRERWWEAHRSHVYQRLSRHWGSHAAVTTAIAVINVVWLAPLAWAAAHYADWRIPLAFLAITPLAGLAIWSWGISELPRNSVAVKTSRRELDGRAR